MRIDLLDEWRPIPFDTAWTVFDLLGRPFGTHYVRAALSRAVGEETKPRAKRRGITTTSTAKVKLAEHARLAANIGTYTIAVKLRKRWSASARRPGLQRRAVGR